MTDSESRPNGSYVARNREIEIPGVAITGPTVDLAAWARGEEDHEFADVLRAVEEKLFDRIYALVVARAGSIRNLHEALEWCVKEGLIRESEQRDDL